MLVLSRKANEAIQIGDTITISVLSIRGVNVRLGLTAPPNVTLHRDEVYRKIKGKHDEKEACK